MPTYAAMVVGTSLRSEGESGGVGTGRGKGRGGSSSSQGATGARGETQHFELSSG